MAKQKRFDDPLEGIDPVMEQAFSDFATPSEEDSAADELVDFQEEDEEAIPKKKKPKTQATKIVEEEEDLDEEDVPQDHDHRISEIEFPGLNQETSGRKVEMEVFGNIPVNLSVELGRSQISLKEVFELTEGSIIELERLVGEPLDLVVNGQVIAQGEVVAIDNNYGLRVTSVLSPQ